MTRTDKTTESALPSALELHLSSLVRSSKPFAALDVAAWAREADLLSPDGFAAWCRAGLDMGKEAEGASAAVPSVVLFLRALHPAADLAALRSEAVTAYITDDLGTGRPAATTFLTILDLLHIAALSRATTEAQ